MTTASVRTILLLTALSLLLTAGLQAGNVALITKTIKDVTKAAAAQDDWVKASKGVRLLSGDKVQTGGRSLAVVKFLDNSIVRVRELSVLTLVTEKAGTGIMRSVALTKGGYGFEVKKQQNDQFRLTSPTSVASIRGTRGRFSGGMGRDTLVVTEGLVNLRNTASGQEVDVAEGEIGFSNEDGTITSRKAAPQELADAANAASGGAEQELKLELRDPQGNTKNLKLRFKQ
jgi:hypothetical protein